jgi:biopolymer transport protein ExbB
MNFLLLQIPTTTNSLAKDTSNIAGTDNDAVTEKTLSIIELISSGGIGGNLVMGALGILSIFAIYILIERYSAIKKASKEDESFLKSIQNFVEGKDIEAAKTLCRNTDSPISRMIEKGVNRIDKPMNDISAAIENQGKLEVFKMENNLANLATISGAAPMIGFLGTVIGMIVAFHEMASAGGNIDVAMLSQGIYTAMVTTVAGLVVGIIAFIAYNYLVSKVDKVVFMLEAKTTEFLDLLHHNE